MSVSLVALIDLLPALALGMDLKLVFRLFFFDLIVCLSIQLVLLIQKSIGCSSPELISEIAVLKIACK